MPKPRLFEFDRLLDLYLALRVETPVNRRIPFLGVQDSRVHGSLTVANVQAILTGIDL